MAYLEELSIEEKRQIGIDYIKDLDENALDALLIELGLVEDDADDFWRED